jgi:hypothetical protein
MAELPKAANRAFSGIVADFGSPPREPPAFSVGGDWRAAF